MKKIFIYTTLIIIILGGCKKVDLEETPSGDPVFSVTADLDNSSLNLVAGDDDFYMFSEFSKDNFEVYTLTGRFAKDNNCSIDCSESLSFSIRSSSATPANSQFVFENSISINDDFGYFSNNNMEVSGHRYFFTGELVDSFGSTQATTYSWEIITDSTSFYSGKNIVHEYFGTEDLAVRLSITTPNGCPSYLESTIPNGGNNFCNLFVEANLDSNGFYELVPIFGNPIFDSFLWNNDSTLITPFQLSPNQVPNGLLTLEASNTNCNVDMGICVSFTGGAAASSIAFPQMGLQVQDTTMITGIGEQFSTVIIEYQDETGTYSSINVNNSNSTFTITKIEDYENNEHNEKTKKLTINYNCILEKEGSGEQKTISGTAVIAVAYPD